MTLFKSRLYRGVENIWAFYFWLSGRFLHPEARLWVSTGGKRVLVIAPHPDDEVVGCAGTILCHKQAGDEIRVVFVTDGSGSRAMGLNEKDMRQRRKEEALASLKLLEVEKGIFFDLPEKHWEIQALVGPLETLLREFTPHYLYAPSRLDFHSTHHQVAHAIALALKRVTEQPDSIRIYPIHVPLPWDFVNLVTPTHHVEQSVETLLKSYTTQWGSLARVPRIWRYAAAYYGVKKQAEVFWELQSQAYIQLHIPTLPWPTQIFRGVRARPFTDPFAYWLKGSVREQILSEISKAQ